MEERCRDGFIAYQDHTNTICLPIFDINSLNEKGVIIKRYLYRIPIKQAFFFSRQHTFMPILAISIQRMSKNFARKCSVVNWVSFTCQDFRRIFIQKLAIETNL